MYKKHKFPGMNPPPKKDNFMVTAQDIIVKARPELTGRFTALHIWESLIYLKVYRNMTAEQAAAKILETDYSKVHGSLLASNGGNS